MQNSLQLNTVVIKINLFSQRDYKYNIALVLNKSTRLLKFF